MIPSRRYKARPSWGAADDAYSYGRQRSGLDGVDRLNICTKAGLAGIISPSFERCGETKPRCDAM